MRRPTPGCPYVRSGRKHTFTLTLKAVRRAALHSGVPVASSRSASASAMKSGVTPDSPASRRPTMVRYIALSACLPYLQMATVPSR